MLCNFVVTPYYFRHNFSLRQIGIYLFRGKYNKLYSVCKMQTYIFVEFLTSRAHHAEIAPFLQREPHPKDLRRAATSTL